MTLNSLIKDQNSTSVQIGSSFTTVDGNSHASPFTLTGGIDNIVVPQGAVEFIVNPTSANLSVSSFSDLSSYDVILNGSKESIPCARMQNIYVQGTGVINFRFTIV